MRLGVNYPVTAALGRSDRSRRVIAVLEAAAKTGDDRCRPATLLKKLSSPVISANQRQRILFP
jgi:hypothetical protein